MAHLHANCPICGDGEFEQIVVNAHWFTIPRGFFGLGTRTISFRCTNCAYVLMFAPDRRIPDKKKSKPLQADLLLEDWEYD
jgi:uncharacterized Zn finger protein